MLRRIVLTIVLLCGFKTIWTSLQSHDLVKSVTKHPEWPVVEQHSRELLQSVQRIGRDQLVEALELPASSGRN